MDRVGFGELVLAADALGCLATGAVVATAPSVYRVVDSSGRSRPLVAGLLVATSGSLSVAARNPTRAALGRSAALNLVWALGCLAVLPKQQSDVGRSVVAATAVLDAGMAGLQWYLRRSALR